MLPNTLHVPQSNIQIWATLPSEIVILVITCLPPDSLASVIRVSKRFKDIAEPILYRNVTLRRFPQRTLTFYSSLINRPALAALVRSIYAEDIIPYTSDISWTSLTRQNPEATRIHRQKVLDEAKLGAYKQLSHMEDLYLGVGTRRWFKSMDAPYRLFTKMPLRRLFLREMHWDMDQTGLLTILRDHPQITHLELPIMFDDLGSLQDGDLPLLETFAGEAIVAEQIIPGRPVKSIHLKSTSSSFPTDYTTILRALARSTAQVEHLTIDMTPLLDGEIAWVNGGGMLDAVAKCLPYITRFRLKGRLGTSMWNDTLESLPDSIKGFYSLQTLDMQGCFVAFTGLFGYEQPDHSECDTILETWATGCPTLHNVIFPDGCRWCFKHGMWNSGCAEARWKKMHGQCDRWYKKDLAASDIGW